MQIDKIVAAWRARGIVVIPGFVDAQEVEALRCICDDVLEQSIAEDQRRADARNIAYLTEPRYFVERESDLMKLLEFVADDRIVSLLTQIAGEIPLFHNTQYFHNPRTNSHDGEWHRDTQFLAQDEELERKRISQTTGVHFRVAFLPDRQLEYVAGSEQRWDSPEELAVRKGDNPTRPDMPGGERIELGAGDACLFHGWGIHRGTYRREVPRRTLDVIYGWGGVCDWAPPPPTCFRDKDLLARLSPGAQKFFDYFIRSYEATWK
jgi:ectoine hydroxylase-related dioxygenase (phytanoyl-CoA dioxygenase family)